MNQFTPTAWTPLSNFVFEGAWPTSVAFFGGNRRIAAGNRDGQILIWEVPDGFQEQPADAKSDKNADDAKPGNLLPIRQLVGHTNAISHLLATSDGKTLISTSYDHSIRLWEAGSAASGQAELVLDAETRQKKVRYKKGEEREQILNAPGVKVQTQTETAKLEGHTSWVTAAAISANGKRLITGDQNANVIVWDLSARKKVSQWKGHAWNGISAAALTAEGDAAIVAEYKYKRDDFDIPAAALRVWNVEKQAVEVDVLKTVHPKLKFDSYSYGAASVWRKYVAGGLVSVAYSPDNSLLAAAQGGETGTGVVHLHDAKSGKKLREMSKHRYGVTSVRFSPDGQFLLSTGRDTMLRICETATGKEVAALGKTRGGQFKDWLHGFALSDDCQTLAAADIAGLVQVWKAGS